MRRLKSLYFASDKYNWALDQDAQLLGNALKGIASVSRSRVPWRRHYGFFHDRYQGLSHAKAERKLFKYLGVNYFHGFPWLSKENASLFEKMVRNGQFFDDIRVSHTAMGDTLRDAGLGNKIRLVRIPVHLSAFPLRSADDRMIARQALGIPSEAFVVGSFQKDGAGWNKGDVPKLEKGPDIFVNSLAQLSETVQGLHVLLSGPSRGYVLRRLTEMRIPHTYRPNVDYYDMRYLYASLDTYLIASRDEGGPKSLLESMASGVPVVSTPVGQAKDLINHDANGFISDSFDHEELADLVLRAKTLGHRKLVTKARKLAESFSIESQLPEWKSLFRV